MQQQSTANNTSRIARLPSPALQRIMEEVRNSKKLEAIGGSYDRTHNRHNRGQ